MPSEFLADYGSCIFLTSITFVGMIVLFLLGMGLLKNYCRESLRERERGFAVLRDERRRERGNMFFLILV